MVAFRFLEKGPLFFLLLIQNAGEWFGGTTSAIAFNANPSVPVSLRSDSRHKKFETSLQAEDEEKYKVGSTEYIQGMLSRPIDQESAERVSGDKLLGPTIKLAAQVSLVLILLTLGFFYSNGML